MDILMMRLLGRILMIIGALGLIVYGIVFITKKQDRAFSDYIHTMLNGIKNNAEIRNFE